VFEYLEPESGFESMMSTFRFYDDGVRFHDVVGFGLGIFGTFGTTTARF
jgi:hypothetical protein